MDSHPNPRYAGAMGSDNERRRPPARHKVSLFIGLGSDNLPFARSRDLSLNGVFLETEARPPVDTICNISLVWGEDSFICAARVVRHAVDGIALTYVNPDSVFLAALQDIIANLESAPGTGG